MERLEEYLERRAAANALPPSPDEDFAVQCALGNCPEMRYAVSMLYTPGVLTKRQAE